MHSSYAATINTHFSKLLILGQQLGLFLSPTQYLKDQENTNQNSNAVKNSYKTVIRLKGFGAATERYIKPNMLLQEERGQNLYLIFSFASSKLSETK